MKTIPRIVDISTADGRRQFQRLAASPPTDPAAEELARTVLEAVRRGGDRAVARYAARFDGVGLSPERFAVTSDEIRAAERAVSGDFRRAVDEVLEHVEAFARAGLRRDWILRTRGGGRLGEVFVPLDRVGVYVPGGASPLASTALMTIPLARVAGVREIAATSPCRRDGTMEPHVLYAMARAGATEIYRLGGVQAIAALALGTERIRRVDKLVGPGGPFVTAAKRCVYGQVALDMVAGPSEIAVLADSSADPAVVATDLLSQAEHGTGRERTLLVTDSPDLARTVAEELQRQGQELPRWPSVRQVLRTRSLIVCVRDLLTEGTEVVNEFAPEHLEILARVPRRFLPKIRHAGAVFLGRWTPESAGDFAAGPSHVLPTGGTARFFSGLTVEDFRRRMSVLELTRDDLVELMPAILELARVEELPAHARSAQRRLEAMRSWRKLRAW